MHRSATARAKLTPTFRIMRLHELGALPLVLRGREFDLHDLRVVLHCIAKHWPKGRTYISQRVCEALNWRQPNGWLKERACRDVLRILDARRLVALPPALVRHPLKKRRAVALHSSTVAALDLATPIVSAPRRLRFEMAKGDRTELLWNYLVDKYHYLGYTAAVGRCLKYVVWADDRVLGAIAFSSPAWRLTTRDEVLGRLGIARRDLHDRVINNSRFLILPHVRVNHLASRILAQACDQVVRDWTNYYGVEPFYAETFVQPSRFEGICYRAANWIVIGTTRGYSKAGATHHNGQEPKYVFLYGLNRRARVGLAKHVPVYRFTSQRRRADARPKRTAARKGVHRRPERTYRSTAHQRGRAQP